jgi:cytochrome c biogenesis protein ResB
LSSSFDTLLDRVWSFFASVKLTIVLLVFLAAAMAYGTFVETSESNAAARILVYRAWWFDTLIFLLALNLIGCTLRRAPYRIHQIGWLTTHVALLILMTGSVVTHRFGVQGQIILPEGETTASYNLEQVDLATRRTIYVEPLALPFRLYCKRFAQVMYPGSGTTAMFRSDVGVIEPTRSDTQAFRIVLNHPLVYAGYKINQDAFTTFSDGRIATVLGVSYDPGMPFMIVGGMLLVLGMAGIFFLKPYLKRKFPPPPKAQKAKL